MFDYIINTNTILQNQLCTNTLHPKRGRTQAHDPPNEQACLRLCVCVWNPAPVKEWPPKPARFLLQITWCLHRNFLVQVCGFFSHLPQCRQQAFAPLSLHLFAGDRSPSSALPLEWYPAREAAPQGAREMSRLHVPIPQLDASTPKAPPPTVLSKAPGWHSHHCERRPDCVATGHAPCQWLCFQAAKKDHAGSHREVISATGAPRYCNV